MQPVGQIVNRPTRKLAADIVAGVSVFRFEVGGVIVAATGGVTLIGIVIEGLRQGVLRTKLNALAGILAEAERPAPIHGTRRALPQGDLTELRQRTVGPVENKAAVGCPQRGQGQVVIAVPFSR